MTTRLSKPCTLYTVLYLLPAVRGQVEDEYGEEGDAHTGDDQVDRVEERLPPHGQDERDVSQHLKQPSHNLPQRVY